MQYARGGDDKINKNYVVQYIFSLVDIYFIICFISAGTNSNFVTEISKCGKFLPRRGGGAPP